MEITIEKGKEKKDLWKLAMIILFIVILFFLIGYFSGWFIGTKACADFINRSNYLLENCVCPRW